jgi:hypothetical protein
LNVRHQKTGNPQGGAKDDEPKSQGNASEERIAETKNERYRCHYDKRREAAQEINVETALARARRNPERGREQANRNRGDGDDA